MTGEQELSSDDIIRAVRKALEEFVPSDTDPQDIEEFIETLEGNDPDELLVNLGAGFGQLCDSEKAADDAFARYAELIDADRVVHNPIPNPES